MPAPKNTRGRTTLPKTKSRVAAPKPSAPAVAGRLVLLKVLVQPVLVLVDDDGAREVAHPVVEVKGPDWHTWAAAAFTAASLEQMRDGITTQPAT